MHPSTSFSSPPLDHSDMESSRKGILSSINRYENNSLCSSPNNSCDKMKKPMMEKKRRERINNSLAYLKEFLLNVAPQQRSKLEKADIMEMIVKYLEEQKNNSSGKSDCPSLYRKGKEDGFTEGFTHASRAVFTYLQLAMPHDVNPHAQQFHLGLLNYLNSSMPRSALNNGINMSMSNFSTPVRPAKCPVMTPPSSECSATESPGPSSPEEPPILQPEHKKVWQPWN
uniref:BHLH domain-containing protein n=1 Tax=Heterorhabditis bacteriophora TaxID=37862 RepID=A0A1I7WWN6_HETBA